MNYGITNDPPKKFVDTQRNPPQDSSQGEMLQSSLTSRARVQKPSSLLPTPQPPSSQRSWPARAPPWLFLSRQANAILRSPLVPSCSASYSRFRRIHHYTGILLFHLTQANTIRCVHKPSCRDSGMMEFEELFPCTAIMSMPLRIVPKPRTTNGT